MKTLIAIVGILLFVSIFPITMLMIWSAESLFYFKVLSTVAMFLFALMATKDFVYGEEEEGKTNE